VWIPRAELGEWVRVGLVARTRGGLVALRGPSVVVGASFMMVTTAAESSAAPAAPASSVAATPSAAEAGLPLPSLSADEAVLPRLRA
jgi:hypothetical protein